MKLEELKFSTEHLSGDGVHLLMSTATNTKHLIFICTATKYNGMRQGKSTTEYTIDGTRYTKKDEFVKALKQIN